MVFLPESFPHQSHHLNRTGSNAQSIYSIPGINGCVRCFSSYCDTLCGKSVACRISQVKIFFYRHHVYMCGHNNIRMIKFSKPDQLAFSGCRKTDSLFPEPCTFICINVFFRRNGKKRYGPRQRGLNLLIGQCQCCADHGCNLCVVSACMCCPVNGISHRM